MKRQYRLSESERFRQLRQEGKSFSHRLLVLCVLRNDVGHSRCGITVSRRVGGAVIRNRVRRRIGEAVRLAWEMIEPGWDMVWVARAPVVRADYLEIRAVTAQLLHRAGLWHEVRPQAQTGVSGVAGEARRLGAAGDTQSEPL